MGNILQQDLGRFGAAIAFGSSAAPVPRGAMPCAAFVRTTEVNLAKSEMFCAKSHRRCPPVWGRMLGYRPPAANTPDQSRSTRWVLH